MPKMSMIAAATMVALAVPVLATADGDPEWLFVHSAEAAVRDGDSLMVPVSREIFALTDRPERRHARLNAHEFVMGWDEHDNSFLEDPPNVVITWVEDGEVERVEAIFADASVQDLGRSIQYKVTGVDTGGMPRQMSEVSIYVDGGCIPNGMAACGASGGEGPGGLF